VELTLARSKSNDREVYISLTRPNPLCSAFSLFVLLLFVMADSEIKAVPSDVEDTALEQMGYQPGELILFGLNHQELV
jgi:hypothetical protein